MRLLISGSWVRAPRWAKNSFYMEQFLKNIFDLASWFTDNRVIQAPWLSWLKRLSRKQEIPSSTLGGALIILLLFMATGTEDKDLQKCRDPGSNRGPLDLQSNALPTELSRLDKRVSLILVTIKKRSLLHDSKTSRSYRDLNSDRWIQSPEC
jgi:hypothetical protein